MLDKVTHVPILVRDQDQALDFYVGKLGFENRQDYGQKGKARWLTIAPPGSAVEFALVKGRLASDAPAEESYQVTLTTDDCRREVAKLKARGVAVGEPVQMPFGTLAKFADPDGNRFALLQPSGAR